MTLILLHRGIEMDKVNKLNALNSHNQHGCNNNQQNKQIKIGNYILGKTIGKGNSAVVKIATHSIIKQKVIKLI